MKFVWEIKDKIVKVENDVGMGLNMSPILTELKIRKWEEEKLKKKQKRIKQFSRYVQGSIGIYRGIQEELKEEVKKIEESQKGIQLGVEEVKEGKIRFLNIDIARENRDGNIKIR